MSIVQTVPPIAWTEHTVPQNPFEGAGNKHTQETRALGEGTHWGLPGGGSDNPKPIGGV